MVQVLPTDKRDTMAQILRLDGNQKHYEVGELPDGTAWVGEILDQSHSCISVGGAFDGQGTDMLPHQS